MYIRIQDSRFRFRISSQEAQQLIGGDILLDAIPLSKTLKLTYSVETTQQVSKFEYSEIDNSLILKVNSQDLINELQARPSKQGLKILYPIHEQQTIEVFLQVDMKTNNSTKKL